MATTTTTTTMTYQNMSPDDQEALKKKYFKSAHSWDFVKLKSCIDRGIPVGIRDDDGWNALHLVSEGFYSDDDEDEEYCSIDLAKYLVHECHIDVNALTYDGRTALHLANSQAGG
jgi:hypothetical protein